MFYAARTFAMKLGQSIAMLLFTRMATIGNDAAIGTAGYGIGYRITAFSATVLCLLGGIVFLRYNEKKIIDKIDTANKED
jgi:GPH family glycoside/pentoside/hexuronide:cation symporter